jgi:hypothetical protein
MERSVVERRDPRSQTIVKEVRVDFELYVSRSSCTYVLWYVPLIVGPAVMSILQMYSWQWEGVLTLVLEESEEILPPMLEVILKNLLKKGQGRPHIYAAIAPLPTNLPVSLSARLAGVHFQCQTF